MWNDDQNSAPTKNLHWHFFQHQPTWRLDLLAWQKFCKAALTESWESQMCPSLIMIVQHLDLSSSAAGTLHMWFRRYCPPWLFSKASPDVMLSTPLLLFQIDFSLVASIWPNVWHTPLKTNVWHRSLKKNVRHIPIYFFKIKIKRPLNVLGIYNLPCCNEDRLWSMLEAAFSLFQVIKSE